MQRRLHFTWQDEKRSGSKKIFPGNAVYVPREERVKVPPEEEEKSRGKFCTIPAPSIDIPCCERAARPGSGLGNSPARATL